MISSSKTNSKSEPPIWSTGISLIRLTKHYRRKITITWLLLFLEKVVELLFPVAIGLSVDGLINHSYSGIYLLVSLCVLMLILGAARRFYDTRAYASIYRDLANGLVHYKRQKGATTSKVTALINLLYEVVEFFEESLPALIGTVVAFFGVIIILAFLDIKIMYCALAACVLVAIVYIFSDSKTYSYNSQQNNELERQVEVIDNNRKRRIDLHFRRILKWKIKLSDLETINFSIVWLILASLLIISIVFIVDNATISIGDKITAIMYVFEYIEVIMGLPFFYQELVRLREITQRLSLD